MNICFYYINESIPDYAECFIKSVRKWMPSANMIQLTDMKTPSISGVDDIRRQEPKYGFRVSTINHIGYQYLASLQENEVVFTDIDMLYNGSVEHILEGDFDVAVATRSSDDNVSDSYKKRFPFCSMMAVKNRQFWKDCYQRLLRFRKPMWTNNMEAVASAIRSQKYKVKLLSGNIYNKNPKSYDKSVLVYHFKNDKTKMKPFYEKYIKDAS